MKKVLDQLSHQLATRRPAYYAQLNPALDESAINRLEHHYNRPVPDELKVLYGWKNGQGATCYEAFVNNSMFMPLERVLETAREHTALIGFDFDVENSWHPAWLPLFENGGGDLICYDTDGLFTGERGQLIEFWHADNDRNVIAPSLGQYIDSLNLYYETTDPQEYDEYFSVDTIDGFPKRFVLD